MITRQYLLSTDSVSMLRNGSSYLLPAKLPNAWRDLAPGNSLSWSNPEFMFSYIDRDNAPPLAQASAHFACYNGVTARGQTRS